jgi:uncharacterized LabA/DUF88 family protein
MSRLEQDGEIWQTYFFAAVTDPPKYQQTGFYNMLKQKLRWETEIFPLGNKTFTCKNCNKIHKLKTEKGVDVALATKRLTHAIHRAFDTAILVSGDKDYLDTVRTVKTLGLRVEVVSFERSLSPELSAESSVPVLFLDNLRSEIEILKPDLKAEELVSVEEEV